MGLSNKSKFKREDAKNAKELKEMIRKIPLFLYFAPFAPLRRDLLDSPLPRRVFQIQYNKCLYYNKFSFHPTFFVVNIMLILS